VLLIIITLIIEAPWLVNGGHGVSLRCAHLLAGGRGVLLRRASPARDLAAQAGNRRLLFRGGPVSASRRVSHEELSQTGRA
jgi:hypothetical protein